MPTVLIADDEKNILQLARMYLQAEGFTVETAGNGREALEKGPPGQAGPASTRPDDARDRRLGGLPAAAQGERSAHHHAHRARRRRRQDRWPRAWRRRLHDQAVQRPRAGRAGQGGPAALFGRQGARESPPGGRPAHRSRAPRGHHRRTRHRAAAEGVRAADDAGAQSRRRLRPRAPAQARLGLRLLRRLTHGRRARDLAARKTAREHAPASRPSGASATNLSKPNQAKRPPRAAGEHKCGCRSLRCGRT